MAEFKMPSLGADMESGLIAEWLVKPGDRVTRGQIIATVETMKGIIEVEVFEPGIVDRILVEPGIEVPVGTVLAILRPNGEVAPSAGEVVVAGAPAPAPSEVVPAGTPSPPAPSPRKAASPSARRLAREIGVDLSALAGTGPGGAILLADVERARTGPASGLPPGALTAAPPAPAGAMRLAIARAMARSNREIPHYYLATTIDLLPATTWLAQQNEQRPMEKRLLIGALFLKATAHALKEVPELNGWWKEEQLETSASVHIGVAISTRSGGLLIPAIHDVDRKPIDAVMADLADLVERARNGHLRSSELTDGTITVTSLGDRGVELVAGVIYPPQVALVGFGKVVRRPWAVGEDAVAIRPVVTATLAGDHRASDGHRGARFLVALERALAHPEAL